MSDTERRDADQSPDALTALAEAERKAGVVDQQTAASAAAEADEPDDDRAQRLGTA